MKIKVKIKAVIYGISDVFLNFLSLFIPLNSKKVVLVNRVSSGSNINLLEKKLKEKYPSLNLVKIEDRGAGSFGEWVAKKLSLYSNLLTAKVVVTTHGPLLKTFKNITIDLWHAFPTKKTGLMLNDNSDKRFRRMIDYFLSYSSFGTILLNSRYGMKASKYIELGSPRNDYLLNTSGDGRKPSFLEESLDHKIVFFLPTFRDSSSDEYRRENLRFKDFDLKAFNKFLKENKILFVMKFHRNEERKWWDIFDGEGLSNMILLKEEYLEDGYEDFYQVLPFSDLLITDYSSIYVDYLLLNKPMIFTPTDIGAYNKERGLLLEPYDSWRPGPICLTQEELEKAIEWVLKEPAYYREERERLRKIFHEYDDGNSTKRVADFIYSKLKN